MPHQATTPTTPTTRIFIPSSSPFSPPPLPPKIYYLLGRGVEPLPPAAEDVRIPDGVEVVVVVRVDGGRGGRRKRGERDRRYGDEERRGKLHRSGGVFRSSRVLSLSWTRCSHGREAVRRGESKGTRRRRKEKRAKRLRSREGKASRRTKSERTKKEEGRKKTKKQKTHLSFIAASLLACTFFSAPLSDAEIKHLSTLRCSSSASKQRTKQIMVGGLAPPMSPEEEAAAAAAASRGAIFVLEGASLETAKVGKVRV